MLNILAPRRSRDFDLFEELFTGGDWFSRQESALMRTDIKEKKDKYVIAIDLPGFEKENIKVDLQDGYLYISAKVERSSDDDGEASYVRRERFFGQCSRSFYVGEQVKREDIKAAFKNGVLRLTVPKKQTQEELPASTQIAIE